MARRRFTLLLLAAAAAALLAGCQSEPVRAFQADMKSIFGGSKGAEALAAGVKQYEEGEYAESERSLNSALDLGLTEKEKVRAYKWLAFIHCGSGRVPACREDFRRALAIDPSFELSPAEAGHPTWGPVYRNVKAGR